MALTFNTRKSVNQQQAGAIVEHRINEVHGLRFTAWGGQRSTEQFQAIPTAVQAPITHPGGVIVLDRDYRGVDGQWIARTRAFGGGLTLTAGLLSDELKERRQGFQNFFGTPAAPTARGVMGVQRRDEDNRVRSFDQYAQGVWEGERFSVTAGLRHSEVKFESRDHFIVGANGDDSGSVRFDATTPVLGIVWHAGDALNLYASLGKGFETPTGNELAYRPDGSPGPNFDLRPATSKQWEIGLKAAPLADWQVNAALFAARTSDEIVVASNVGGRSTFQNAAETLRRGFELATAGNWSQSWSSYAALTWLDATYETGFTCVATTCPAPNNQVAAGNRIPGIPQVHRLCRGGVPAQALGAGDGAGAAARRQHGGGRPQQRLHALGDGVQPAPVAGPGGQPLDLPGIPAHRQHRRPELCRLGDRERRQWALLRAGPGADLADRCQRGVRLLRRAKETQWKTWT